MPGLREKSLEIAGLPVLGLSRILTTNWVALIWGGLAGACLMLALIHGVIWCRNRRRWESFWLSMATFGVIGILACEQVAMFTSSPAVFERCVWWAHMDFIFVCLGVLGFLHTYFGTGNRWLFALAVGTRLLALIANSTTGSSLHFIAIHRLEQIPFLGQQVSVVADWEANPWVRLGQFSSLIWLIYVVDASLRLGNGFSQDERRPIVEGWASLDARLRSFDAGTVDMELSVKERGEASQRTVLEAWISGQTRIVATSSEPDLAQALHEVRDELIRQLTDAKNRTEPRNNPSLRVTEGPER